MSDSVSALELASTQELLDELHNRHKASAFIGTPLIGGTSEVDNTDFSMQGNSLMVLGLVSLLQRIVCDDAMGMANEDAEIDGDECDD